MIKDILKIALEVLIFIGTFISIFCLTTFMFVASNVWFTILSGVGALYNLFIYDRYRQIKNKKNT